MDGITLMPHFKNSNNQNNHKNNNFKSPDHKRNDNNFNNKHNERQNYHNDKKPPMFQSNKCYPQETNNIQFNSRSISPLPKYHQQQKASPASA